MVCFPSAIDTRESCRGALAEHRLDAKDENRTGVAIMIDREGGQLSYCEAEQQQQPQGSVQQRTQYSQQLAFIYIFRYGLSFPFLLKFVGIL